MNKIALSVCSMLLLVPTAASSQTVQRMVEGSFATATHPRQVVATLEDRLDTISVDANGRFAWHFPTADGRRVILNTTVEGRECNIPLYLDTLATASIRLTITAPDSVSFEGTGSHECQYLNLQPESVVENWYKDSGGNYVGFAQFKQRLDAEISYRRQLLNATQPTFRNMYWAKTMFMRNYAFSYALAMLRDGQQPEADADFRDFLATVDVNDRRSQTLLPSYITYKLAAAPSLYASQPEPCRYILFARDHIADHAVLTSLADQYMIMELAVGRYEGMAEALEIYRPIASKQNYDQCLQVYNQLRQTTENRRVSDFVLTDCNGREVRFYDVVGQGKWVYIDFWATWCGPCCLEIPHLAKLVSRMHDCQDITFVSISFDNNLQRWQQKLDKDKPEWAQYIELQGMDSRVARECNIQGIPRFMLFSPDGNIADISAPRPSAPEIETYLKSKIENKKQK